jgi:hypothetical protein
VTKLRASDWLQVFPELLQPSALKGFHSFLPQNVELFGNSHILAMEKPDLIVAGFPCQGFSRTSGKARGLADPKTHLLTEALRGSSISFIDVVGIADGSLKTLMQLTTL